MKTVARILPLFLLFVICGRCDLGNQEEVPSIHMTKKAAQLVNVNNQFGLELFQNVSESEKDGVNLMVSPMSVALALAMTYNGAETTTREAMEKTLRLYGLSRSDINTAYQTLVNGLKSVDPKVLLEIANAIYYRKDFPVEDAFIAVNKKYYEAEISALDFYAPGVLDIINGWVNTKTHGKIPEILKEITPDQVMFLLNAIYFKGIWTKEFNKEETTEYPFYKEEGGIVTAGMMCRMDTLDYASGPMFSAIRLPYGKGDFNMVVFLPAEGKTVDDLTGQLSMENWGAWMKLFKKTNNVDIRLPKFRFAYDILLNEVLADMGMGIAFTGAADFRGICRSGGIWIDYVRHKTFVEVNEEGTEAAAVTIVAIEKTLPVFEKVPFYVNRPFLFAITEKTTDAILFIGSLKDPSKE